MKRATLKSAACGLLMLVSSGLLHAFKPEFHKRYALEAFETCAARADPGTFPTFEEALAFADGTWMEDKTQRFTRVRNWHYAHNDAMPRTALLGPLPVPIHVDMENIVGQRLDEMKDLASARHCDRRAIFQQAGRLTHFLQDMRVPAHVIPIHHGPLAPSDAFDEYPFHFPADAVPSDVCQSRGFPIAALHDAYLERLRKATDMTSARLRKHIKGRSCTWQEAYWCLPGEAADGSRCVSDQVPFSGFGAYRRPAPGEGGESDVREFGDVRMLRCAGEQAAQPVTTEAFHEFFRPGYVAMLRDTVAMMTFAKLVADQCR